MIFNQIFRNTIEESMTAGGADSAFGPGANSTASQFSKDSYAPGDARNVTGNVKIKVQRRNFPETTLKKNKKISKPSWFI